MIEGEVDRIQRDAGSGFCGVESDGNLATERERLGVRSQREIVVQRDDVVGKHLPLGVRHRRRSRADRLPRDQERKGGEGRPARSVLEPQAGGERANGHCNLRYRSIRSANLPVIRRTSGTAGLGRAFR